MLKFEIKPHDVLFFGCGKPFNIGGVAESIFPPFPNSFASAVYAKFYSKRKIKITNERGIYKAVYGPFIQKEGKIFFPAPFDIMTEKKNEESSEIVISFLQNKFELLNVSDTDIGKKLQKLSWIKSESEKDYKPFKGFISLEGLKKWYNGDSVTKDHLLKEDDIFIREDRISIYLDDTTGTVKEENGLYRVKFIRLQKNVSFVFWVDADFDNGSLLKENNIKNDDDLIEIFNKNPKDLKVGGETRTAFYDVEKHNFTDYFNDFTKKESNSGVFKLLFLTPGILNFDNSFDKSIVDCFTNSNLISGVIDGYVIFGIASKNYDNYKNRTTRAIKPGSLIYLKSLNEADTTNNQSRLPIGFYNRHDNFIGSNLVLIKII